MYVLLLIYLVYHSSVNQSTCLLADCVQVREWSSLVGERWCRASQVWPPVRCNADKRMSSSAGGAPEVRCPSCQQVSFFSGFFKRFFTLDFLWSVMVKMDWIRFSSLTLCALQISILLLLLLFLGNPLQSYGASPAMWYHTMLPATQHRWTCPTLTPARQTCLYSIYLRLRNGRLSWPWCWLYIEMVYLLGDSHPSK